MSIRLTTAKGHPVVIRRPDLIVSLAGYQRQDPETGEVRDFTAITFENREVVFVAGHADVIEAAIEEHARTERINSEYCDRCPALANASGDLKRYEAPTGDVAVFTPTEPELPSWSWPGCPHDQCATPKACALRCGDARADANALTYGERRVNHGPMTGSWQLGSV